VGSAELKHLEPLGGVRISVRILNQVGGDRHAGFVVVEVGDFQRGDRDGLAIGEPVEGAVGGGRQLRAPGALPCSGVGPLPESPKLPIRFTVSCSPLGQPTASSVPHDALRILGTGRVSASAVAGSTKAARSAAASDHRRSEEHGTGRSFKAARV